MRQLVSLHCSRDGGTRSVGRTGIDSLQWIGARLDKERHHALEFVDESLVLALLCRQVTRQWSIHDEALDGFGEP